MTEFGQNRATEDGIHYRCRTCVCEARREDAKKCKADPVRHEKRKARCRKWSAKNQHRRNLRHLYRIDVDVYEAMMAAQGGVCAICRLPERRKFKGVVSRLAVDHCHQTGAIRGLLCSRCNMMIGMAEDTPMLLEMAKEYLTRRRDGQYN